MCCIFVLPKFWARRGWCVVVSTSPSSCLLRICPMCMFSHPLASVEFGALRFSACGGPINHIYCISSEQSFPYPPFLRCCSVLVYD